MSLSTSGRTWEEASSPAALRLARRFEADWRRLRGEQPSALPGLLATYLREAEADAVPGARLALCRAELNLRWEAGDRARASEYIDREPRPPGELVVALLYEEFCLREEAGERPEPSEYLARYPEHAARLRRVLEIHELVGSGGSTAFVMQQATADFPSAGETIAGFRLVEELGRGAFARVFLAEERQLANRPVALKVSRAGSREPQALARLQHTHIVPVHSYRTDPVTGLHLLCMPYFGRVTLGGLLADPTAAVARGGADLLQALDRLGASDPPPAGRAAVRASLAAMSYPRAIAWWGARVAEALEHAHGVGLLHRDVKPSNVLVTRDGFPMLLDFNLAREAVIDAADLEGAVPGGTLDYMAPEQLDELAEGVSDRVGPRSDIYGLGVLLYEALAGSRPFQAARGPGPISDLLARAAEVRRSGPPPLREARPEVPSALAAVVTRCLAPAPEDRYATAADLASDLQAVVDDRPLRFAHEPVGDRLVRWARRNRRPIAMAVPLALAAAIAVTFVLREWLERSRIREEVVSLFEAAAEAETEGRFQEAAGQFNAASRLAERPELVGLREQVATLRARRDRRSGAGAGLLLGAGLEELRGLARRRARLAEHTGLVRENAEKVSRAAETLRFRLAGFGGDVGEAAGTLAEVLKPFFVFDAPAWYRRADLTLLDDRARSRLLDEVNELLYLLALSYDAAAERRAEGRGPRDREQSRALLGEAKALCDRALEFATPPGPWRGLRSRVVALRDGETPPPAGPAPAEATALGSFQWGALRLREGRREEAAAAFRDAVRIEPGNYWYQYFLAFTYDHPSGDRGEALRHYDVALALKPDSPWVRFSRGRLHRAGGNWGQAAEDLRRALEDFLSLPESGRHPAFQAQAGLELGLVRQALADFPGARREYSRVVAADRSGSYARAARLNLAKLDADTGEIDAAKAAYDILLAEDPSDRQARRARALLALRGGALEEAEANLSALIDERANGPDLAELLAFRGLVRLATGRARPALADAEAALEIEPLPRIDRLRTRILLAQGRSDLVRLDDPAAIDALPMQGATLAADVRRLAMAPLPAPGGTPEAVTRRLNRAVALSWLGRHGDAAAVAAEATALAPLHNRARLVLARVLDRGGRLAAARAEVERALTIEPEDAAARVLRGRLSIRAGEPSHALADLERARHLGEDSYNLRAAGGEAALATGDARRAIQEWSRALGHDPEEPGAFLGRARAFLALGEHDAAVADLEQAGAWATDRPALALPIALTYARCLPRRPELIGRVARALRPIWTSWAPAGA